MTAKTVTFVPAPTVCACVFNFQHGLVAACLTSRKNTINIVNKHYQITNVEKNI